MASLARINGLKVISRISVEKFPAGQPRDLDRIAADLDVDTVLEGGVRREGSLLRVSLALVDVTTKRQLWSHSVNHEMSSLLGVQSQIALEVADRLRAPITDAEKSSLMRPATGSAAAYQSFLQARAALSDVLDARSAQDAAARALHSAIEADPNYALAHAQLSNLHSLYYLYGHDRTDERLQQALRSAQQALHLQPDLPEGHIALGNYHYRGFRNYPRALECFQRALATLPANTEALAAVGLIARRQGQWTEATERLERAVVTSPLDPNLHFNLVMTLICVRRY